MAQLSSFLSSIPSLHFTIYADDVSIWMCTGNMGQQEDGPNAIAAFLHCLGVKAFPDKTQYVLILLGTREEADWVRDSCPIWQHTSSVKRTKNSLTTP